MSTNSKQFGDCQFPFTKTKSFDPCNQIKSQVCQFAAHILQLQLAPIYPKFSEVVLFSKWFECICQNSGYFQFLFLIFLTMVVCYILQIYNWKKGYAILAVWQRTGVFKLLTIRQRRTKFSILRGCLSLAENGGIILVYILF